MKLASLIPDPTAAPAARVRSPCGDDKHRSGVTLGLMAPLGALLSFLLCVSAGALKLAYVTDHSLYLCTCGQEPAPCAFNNSCDCKDVPLSALRRPDALRLVHTKKLTVWYTSPLNTALLLNNSYVHHLSLIKCNEPGGRTGQHDYFTVEQLERLTITYPSWQESQSHDFILGMSQSSEVQVGVIHTSILTGKPSLKAFTVQATISNEGAHPFPNLKMARVKLPEASSMFVTFLY